MKKNLFTFLFTLFFLGAAVTLPGHVHAQNVAPAAAGGGGFTGITNPVIGNLGNNSAQAESGSTFTNYFVTIWRALIFIGVIALLFNLVNGAFDWILAGGESAKIQKGRDKMLQSVVGMIVLAASFIIISFLSQLLFSFDLLNLTIPKAGAAATQQPAGP